MKCQYTSPEYISLDLYLKDIIFGYYGKCRFYFKF